MWSQGSSNAGEQRLFSLWFSQMKWNTLWLPKWSLLNWSQQYCVESDFISFAFISGSIFLLATVEGKVLHWQHLIEYISVSDKL